MRGRAAMGADYCNSIMAGLAWAEFRAIPVKSMNKQIR
jgi:hypothetical protein